MTSFELEHLLPLAERLHVGLRQLFVGIVRLTHRSLTDNHGIAIDEVLGSVTNTSSLSNLIMTPIDSYALDEFDRALAALWADASDEAGRST